MSGGVIISEDSIKERIEDGIEQLIFSSRWILAPVFVGLIVALAILMIKFILMFAGLIPAFITMTFDEMAMAILNLLDLALLCCLVLLVTFSGYENFVSKINPAEDHEDRPPWMGHLDYSGLKLKIVSTIVAISLIELLQDFLNIGAEATSPTVLTWRVILHLVFVISGLLLAYMTYVSEKRYSIKEQLHLEE